MKPSFGDNLPVDGFQWREAPNDGSPKAQYKNVAKRHL